MIQNIIDEHIDIIDRFSKDSKTKPRLASLCHAMIKTPSTLASGAGQTAIQLTASALNFDAGQARNAGRIALETIAAAASRIALGILGLVSPCSLKERGGKVNALFQCGPTSTEIIGIDNFPNWKKRIFLPIAGIALSQAFIIMGLSTILDSPLKSRAAAEMKKGKHEILSGLASSIVGIAGIFNPDIISNGAAAST